MTNPVLPKKLHVEKVGEKNGDPIYFVLAPDQPSWVFLNQDGLDILQCCDGHQTPQKIAATIADQRRQFTAEEVMPVVESFLDNMRASKILDQPLAELNDNAFRGIALEITQQCNLRCRHCYLAAGRVAEDELSTAELKALLRSLKEVDGISVAFGGGEPLMREDCLELLEYATSLGLIISLGTNGTLIDRNLAQAIARLPVKVQVSLDGATAQTHDKIRGKGNFALAVRGIDHLIAEGKAKDLLIAYTVMKPNVYEVPKIIEFAMERQIPVIQFPPLTSAGRARKRWNEIRLSDEEQLWFWEYITGKAQELRGQMDLLADCFSMNIHRSGEPHQCTIGTQFRIDPVGNIYPCQCFHFGEHFWLGNVKGTSLREVITGQKIKEIKALSFNRPSLIEACNNCLWKNFCGSGCMGNAYESTGNALRPSSCSVRKKWMEHLFEVELARTGVQ